ncbi:tRNAHis guanylyltransferase-domain-containing protein [Clohesyomyces aquaticus]|uniref:tRNA(His) guanylyltransferase n=1 Tax=Clohesyomyces aquaticus TaxID=1231657 RepID=A0A1Y1ZV57_9PLEO|nr:tRNAHis guanylyltransferase-domain-containing protein [Clohesyomyces aquaticus]
MANSKYEYVRSFEQPDILLANTWIVVRIDGRGFSKLTTKYKFVKPNDRRALDLMNAAAEAVMKELPDLVLAYGNSDEYSFVFHKDCVLFERRASKLTSTIVSTFTSYYTFLWPKYFPASPLTPPLPSFDGRAVCYPSDRNLRDYMSWRQVDCHINNLYNTTFWALVQKGGLDGRTAEQELAGTVSSDKNEILFSRFGINYNNEPEIFKKGSVMYRDFSPPSTLSSPMPPTSAISPTPISHPRPMSQPLTSSILPRELLTSSDPSTPRGPTFLSTASTPSPPPSPRSQSIPTFPMPMSFPQTFTSIHPPPPISKQPLPQLTPLPLPPPTLRPTNRPPPSLNPPNPTAYTNTSPAPSPISPPPIPDRTSSSPPSRHPRKNISHSASASLTLAATSTAHTILNATLNTRPVTSTTSSSTPKGPPPHGLKHRSPSLSVLEGGMPEIPLRISSIPVNNKPRKLSLPSQKSCSTLKGKALQDSGAFGPGSSSDENSKGKARKPSPPLPGLSTMKELPSPPRDRDTTAHTRPRTSTVETGPEHRISVLPDLQFSPTGLGPLDPFTASQEKKTPSPPVPEKSQSRQRNTPTPPAVARTGSAPPGTMTGLNALFAAPPLSPATALQSHPPDHPVPSSTSSQETTKPHKPLPSHQNSASKPNPKSKGKSKSHTTPHPVPESGHWGASLTQAQAQESSNASQSRTAREKDRKKRQKARIVVEHVDFIRDEFWERRPWILSGRAG